MHDLLCSQFLFIPRLKIQFSREKSTAMKAVLISRLSRSWKVTQDHDHQKKKKKPSIRINSSTRLPPSCVYGDSQTFLPQREKILLHFFDRKWAVTTHNLRCPFLPSQSTRIYHTPNPQVEGSFLDYYNAQSVALSNSYRTRQFSLTVGVHGSRRKKHSKAKETPFFYRV